MDISQALAGQGMVKEGETPPVTTTPAPESTPPAPAPTPAAPAKSDPPAAPAATTDTPPANNPPQFDEAKWLNEKFNGQFKSVEEVVNKLKEHQTLSQKYSEVERKAQDFEKKYSENAFANDYVKGLNEFVKKGGDPAIYHKVAGIDITKLTEKDALVMKYRFQHGMTKADAEFKVNRKYKLDETLDANDPDVKDARIDFKIDGEEAKKFLSQYKTEQLKAPETKQEAAEKAMQTRIESWQPHRQPLIDSLKKIEIPIDEKDSITYEVPQSTIDYVNDFMQHILANPAVNLDTTTEGIADMKELLMQQIFFQNRKEIHGQIASAINKKWIKDTSNPGGKTDETPPGTPAPVDNDSSLASFIAKQSGIKY